MNSTSPAIVAQSAVRRLPRPALLGLCLAYVMAGFWGRAPWKNADVTAFGYMMELASGHSHWLTPALAGLPPETDGLLAYWVGALAVLMAPGQVSPEVATRIPFIFILLLTLAATWYGAYYLARSPGAQPVAFAFGGEAEPGDYARALADGALLALMACLGLAQLAHEITSYLTQLCCTALIFYAVAASPYHRIPPAIALALGLPGLALSGAPTVAVLLGMGSAGLLVLPADRSRPTLAADSDASRALPPAIAVALSAGTAAMSLGLGLMHWRLTAPNLGEIGSLIKLLIWFAWPTWPLALWSLWRWRHQLKAWPLHLALPLWFAGVSLTLTFITLPADRALLLSLPALSTLAAFALPTLSRSLGALIDWFALLFFTGAAIVIWVIWIAMMTGVPAQPAANVARLAPGFVPIFSWVLFVPALAATVLWAALVHWRIGRHPAAIWKSLVLPAGGATLGWILVMTLWLPLLDYAKSYSTMAANVRAVVDTSNCAEEYGLSRAQVAAFQHHGGLRLQASGGPIHCPWLLVSAEQVRHWRTDARDEGWVFDSEVTRPVEQRESVLLFRRKSG